MKTQPDSTVNIQIEFTSHSAHGMHRFGHNASNETPSAAAQDLKRRRSRYDLQNIVKAGMLNVTACHQDWLKRT